MTMDPKLRALVGREITRTLEATSRIDPRYLNAVSALLQETWNLEIADGGGEVIRDGQPLATAVANWIASPAAAPFLAQPASGSGRTPVPPAGKRRSEMTNSEKGAYIARHGLTAYQQLPA